MTSKDICRWRLNLARDSIGEASTAIERAASFVAAVEVYLGPQLQE